MVILYASDTHVNPLHIDRLLFAAQRLEPDAVVIGGDVIAARGRTLAQTIALQRAWVSGVLLPRLEAFRRQCGGVPVLFDCGNDDVAAARPLLSARDPELFRLIHGRIVDLGEVVVAGYSFVPPTPFKLKDWEKPDCEDRPGFAADARSAGARTDTGEERPQRLSPAEGTIEGDLARLSSELEAPGFSDRLFLFVSHSPPFETLLDRLYDGRQVGSLAVRRFIERWGPTGRLLASFHGHIHEGYRTGAPRDRVGGVPCFNVGQEGRELRALLWGTADSERSGRLVSVRDDGAGYRVHVEAPEAFLR